MSSQVRAESRRKKIIKTVSMGGYARLVSVAVSLLMVPLAIKYLGTEQYGLWVAISSFIAILEFLDGGAGNALLNMISHATGLNSNKSLKMIVSSGFFLILVVSLLGGFLFVLISPFVPWGWMFGVADPSLKSKLPSVILVVGLAFFANMIFSVVGKVQRGYQEGNIEAFWNANGRLLSLAFVYIAIQLDMGLTWFAFAFVMGPISASIANSIYYFFIRKRELLLKVTNIRLDLIKELAHVGGLFFILQIAAAIQFQSDNIIIANMLGPASVAQYSISMQLCLIPPVFMRLIFAPLWPAYREALSSDDIEWVKRVFFKSVRWALLVGVPAAIILVLFGQDVIRLWAGKEVVPSISLLFGCGVWMVFMIIGNTLSVLLNALQVVKIQIAVAVSASVLNIFLSILLIHRIGVEGAIYGTIISYFICAIVPYFIIVPRSLRGLNSRVAY